MPHASDATSFSRRGERGRGVRNLRYDPLKAHPDAPLSLQWHLRRGEWREAEAHLRAAVARLTARNPNPADGEAYYYLGLALKWQVGRGWVNSLRGPAAAGKRLVLSDPPALIPCVPISWHRVATISSAVYC